MNYEQQQRDVMNYEQQQRTIGRLERELVEVRQFNALCCLTLFTVVITWIATAILF